MNLGELESPNLTRPDLVHRFELGIRLKGIDGAMQPTAFRALTTKLIQGLFGPVPRLARCSHTTPLG
jgi:hypothetical protein